MSRTPIWRRYLRFFGPNVHADVQDELRFHLETKTRDLIAQGRTPHEARREAMRQFGDIAEVSALCRDIGEEQDRRTRRADYIAEWWYDIHHAVRSMRRSPRFALIAIFTLAAGIAGASSLFSIVDAWIIRAVRFPQSQQLVVVHSLDKHSGQKITVSVADYQDLREQSHKLQSLASWSIQSYAVSLTEGAERVAGANVSFNFFSTLGVEPVLGRRFLESESQPGRDRVVIISHGFWKARLNGDPAVIGSTLKVDGEPRTIVGVLPEQFHLPLVGRVNLWTMLAPIPGDRSHRQVRYMELMGRMKPGVTVALALEELKTNAARLAAAYPDTNANIGAVCNSLREEVGIHTGESILMIVFGVTLGLLLLACSNVANLLLVRSLGRRRQASIQLSLGAGRGRLIRQALTETLCIFFIAAGAGIFGGQLLTDLATGFIPFESRGYLPDYGTASLNWTVISYVLGVTLITGLIFGLAPAFEESRTNIASVLKESGSAVSQSTKARRLRFALVTVQIILATVLLSTTAVLVKGFRATWSAPLGFDSSGVLTFKLVPDHRQYADPVRRLAFFERVQSALQVTRGQALPALSNFLPFGMQSGATTFRIQGQEQPDGRRPPSASFNAVSAEYFATLKTPMLSGRAFDNRDSREARAVAIVNDGFVARFLHGKNPIGQIVSLGRLDDRNAEIVGVVPEIREYNDPRNGHPQIYVPFAQAAADQAYFIVRSQNAAANPVDLLPEIRKRIAAIDSQQPVFDAKTFGERLRETFAAYEIVSGILVWFGFLAVLLAAVGVYAVVAFSVSQRTREIGIRAALGAGRAALLRMFLRQGLAILTIGLIPGLAGSIAIGTVLRSLLGESVSPNLAGPLFLTFAIVSIVVFFAILAPARKAASADPLQAIRYE